MHWRAPQHREAWKTTRRLKWMMAEFLPWLRKNTLQHPAKSRTPLIKWAYYCLILQSDFMKKSQSCSGVKLFGKEPKKLRLMQPLCQTVLRHGHEWLTVDQGPRCFIDNVTVKNEYVYRTILSSQIQPNTTKLSFKVKLDNEPKAELKATQK